MMNRLLACLVLLAGCQGTAQESAPAPEKAANAAQTEKAAATKVARVVFVGKAGACECTQKSINASWAALEASLGKPAKVPIEKLELGVDGAKIEPLQALKPIMAVPALYFLDAKGGLIEQLQGEVTQAQVDAVLAK